MRLFLFMVSLVFLGLPAQANEEELSLEMLIFLAEYSDEEGNWYGPELDESSESQDEQGEIND